MTILLIILAVLNLVLVAVLLLRKSSSPDHALNNQLETLEKNQARMEKLLRDEGASNRDELGKSFETFRKVVQDSMASISTLQGNQLESFSKQLSTLTQMNEQKLEKVRSVVEERLKTMQEDNSQKLERMRETVDEKLHSTLEKRLGDSFRLVSERLEKVHQGLGEMQSLASGVGDLKKILSNVKNRGTWGEIQLENILEQTLTIEQYSKNVITKKGSRDPVEFAIKLPGRNGNVVYLPIDAKFPKEDYERLQMAQDQVNPVLVEEATKALENRIKGEAKDIRDKYLDPPNTTDFGILFLSFESLYAEVLRRPGLVDVLRRDYRVLVTGPTTIAALLNSLQMGFRTLAVEKRASEVWNILGTIKTEFGKFGDILDKTHKKLVEASNTIEEAKSKTRGIEQKLKNVQDLPAAAEITILEEKKIDALLK